jgi:hypothetical protein
MAITASEITTANTLEQLRGEFNNLVTDVTGLESGTLAHTEINTATISATTFNLNEGGTFVFEGATSDAFETNLVAADPTADRTITLPDVTGTINVDGNPSSADGETLGTASLEWSDLYLADSAVVYFGNDQDVTLTHVPDTGVLLNAAMVVQFRDSAINIGSPADGDLAIAADDEIDITSTLIDVNGNLDVSGTALITGVTTHGGNVVSDTDSTDDLGTTGVRWANLFVDAITATDQITATGFTGTLDGILGSGTPAAATVTTLTSGGNVVSDTDSTDDLGTTSVRWANLYVDAITATDQITATGFTGTLDGILGSGAAAAATTTTLASTTITASGVVSVDDITDTSSGTTGSIHTDGGLGIAKKLFVGTNATVAGTTLMTGVATHGGNVVSDTDSTDDLGTTGVRWANLFVDAITATDQITATGFTGTLDGILGSGTPAAASVTTLDVSLDATIGDDLTLISDNAILGFGENTDVTLRHMHDIGLSLSAGANRTQLEVISTDAGDAAGPTLELTRDSASPAASDSLGNIKFIGKNDADENVTYAEISTLLLDPTDGAEDGRLDIEVMRAGTSVSAIALKENEIELNAADIDINGDVTMASTYTLNLSNIGTATLFKASGNIFSGRDSSGTYAETEGAGYYVYYDANNYTRVLTYVTSGSNPVWQSRSAGVVKSEIESDGDFQSATNSYGSISDERLKEHIEDSGSQWDDVKAMRVRKYSFITDETDGPTQLGVIAQELEASGMTGLVKTKPYMDLPADGEGPDVPVLDADGNPTDYKTVKYSVLYMKAVKALQEAMARIETLEAKVTALENA